jgi:nitrogen fixation protein NifB
LSEKVSDTPVKPALPLFAVASKGGILVDQHFGHASDFYIYEYEGGTVRFKERRSVSKYCDGSESCDGNGGGKNVKMDQILEAVQDCVCVVAMRIGEAPKRKLMEKGVKVMMTYGRIEEVVDEAARAFRSERAI